VGQFRVPSNGFIEPCLPSSADKPPSGPDWVHEIMHDGCRLMARRNPVGLLKAREAVEPSGCSPATGTTSWPSLGQSSLPQQIADLDRKVLRLARNNAQVRRFMTAPGVGSITALCLLATIDDQSLQEVEKRWSLCRTDDAKIRIRRNRLDRSHLEMRR